MNKIISKIYLYFSILFLVLGVSVWLPQLFTQSIYPTLLHRSFVLNGFIAYALVGLIQEKNCRSLLFNLVFNLFSLLCFFLALKNYTQSFYLCSFFQGLTLLISRYITRKFFDDSKIEITIFLSGIIFWLVGNISSHLSIFGISKFFHYEHSIILLIIFCFFKLIKTKIDLRFFWLFYFIFFVSSFLEYQASNLLKSISLLIFMFPYFSEFKKNKISNFESSLFYSFGFIAISFLIKGFNNSGAIHFSHLIFLGGYVNFFLISIALKLGLKSTELNKRASWILIIFIFAALTRLSAYLIPKLYFRHLAYSSIVVLIGIGFYYFWAQKKLGPRN